MAPEELGEFLEEGVEVEKKGEKRRNGISSGPQSRNVWDFTAGTWPPEMEKEGDSVLMSLPGLSSDFFLSQSPETLSGSLSVWRGRRRVRKRPMNLLTPLR